MIYLRVAFGLISILYLSSCDSDGSTAPVPIDASGYGSTIDDVLIMADSFVTGLFNQSADHDPVSLEGIELLY